MTCIVGIETPDGVVMGADSAVYWGGAIRLLHADNPKVVEAHGHLWGVAGTQRVLDVIRFGASIPDESFTSRESGEYRVIVLPKAIMSALKEHVPSATEDKADWGLLVGIGSCLYEVDEALDMSRTHYGYSAIGSGARYALGALHATQGVPSARARVHLALEAAALHDDCVRQPFVVKELRSER